MRLRTWLLLAILFVSCLTNPLSSQDEPIRFSSKASYVLLPVLVLDDKGIPLTNLGESDFLIEADAEKQPISSFEFPAEMQSLPGASSSTGSPEFSNFATEKPRHLTIIALDPQNTPLSERKPTNDAVLRFLAKSSQTREPIELVWFNNGKFEVIHRFSTDYSAIRASLERTTFPGDTNYETPIDTSKIIDMNDEMLRRVKRSLQDQERRMQQNVEDDKSGLLAQSLSTVAASYRAIPGAKTLLWVSHGFRLRQSEMSLENSRAESGRGSVTTPWQRAFLDLANANIAVYPIDARGLVAPNDMSDRSDVNSGIQDPRNPGGKASAQTKASHEFLAGMQWVAQETGGIAFTGSNGFENELDRAAADASGTYMLSFRVPQGAKPGWHPIKVSVQHKGVNIITRPGFWLEKKPRPSSDTIEAALTSPFPLTGLPVMVRWADVKPTAKGKSQIGFQVAVPSAMPTSPDFSQRKVSIQVRTAVFDSNEKPIAGTKRDINMDLDDAALQKLLKSAVSYSGVLELPAGEYEVVFAVKDNISGRVGSAVAPLTVK